MAFNEQKLKKLSKTLGLTEQNTIVFLRRQAGFLKNNINHVFRSYEILKEVKETQLQEEVKSLKEKTLYKTKNVLIAKYMQTIATLYQKNGYGAQKIVNHLKLNHAVTLSKSSIESFIKANQIKR